MVVCVDASQSSFLDKSLLAHTGLKPRLMAPGPTPIPHEVLQALAEPAVHHRTPEARALILAVSKALRTLWGCGDDGLVVPLAGTGTLAMEASVINLLSPGDEAIFVDGGKFGARFGKILSTYGCSAIPVHVPWGEAVKAEQIAKALKEHPRAKAVYVQACETSTAVWHPVETLAVVLDAHAKTEGVERALLVVDGITGVGVAPLDMNALGIDVLLGGSQKGLMLPTGLGLVGIGARAWPAIESAQLPRFYADLRRERDALAQGQTAWSTPLALLKGLARVLERFEREGMEKIYARHARLQKAAWAGFEALGCRLLVGDPAARAPGLTAAWMPDGVCGAWVYQQLRDEFGITVAGGQDALKGKIIRVAHMGYMDDLDLVATMEALGRVLRGR